MNGDHAAYNVCYSYLPYLEFHTEVCFWFLSVVALWTTSARSQGIREVEIVKLEIFGVEIVLVDRVGVRG